MEALALVGITALGGFLSLFTAQNAVNLYSITPNITAELGPRLSPDAAIVLPDEANWANTSTRWQGYSIPTYRAVVEVATEKDIQETVRFANSHSISFLTVNGGHGFTSTLGEVNNGIAISVRRMKTLDLNKDGQTARFGPGWKSGEVIKKLDSLKKRTVTGYCECTGLTGVMLGGGHGALQGHYGLLADNLVEARVVLANSSVVTVSEKSNPDLFWALRGAGHNFGIVSEFHYKVYDKEQDDRWTVARFIYSGDKLEDVFGVSNALTDNGKKPTNHPVELTYQTTIIRKPELDPQNAVLSLGILYEGSAEKAERIVKLFRDLRPISAQEQVSKYAETGTILGNQDPGPVCQPLGALHSASLGLQTYNLTALRAAYNIFNQYTADHEVLSHSFMLLENYAVQQVRAVPDESTAVSTRQYDILVGNFAIHPVTSPEAATLARGYVRQIRDVLFQGSRLRTMPVYVNYAGGDETVEQIYGDGWRLEKLRRLKKKYDPHGWFDFYNPID